MTSDKDTDDIARLARAMEAASPAPDAARRAENIALAQENFATLQGSRGAGRQTSQTAPKRGLIAGVLRMLTTRKTAAGLTATTALVAVGLLVLGPNAGQILQPPSAVIEPLAEPLSTDATPQEAASPTVLTGEATEQTDTFAEALSPQVDLADLRSEDVDTRRTGGTSLAESESAENESDAPLMQFSMAPTAETVPAEPLADGFMIRINPGPADPDIAVPTTSTESYSSAPPSPLYVTAENPVSTFSIDVDTASYALLRATLSRGQLPAPEAVRIEEMVNYFDYAYPAPGPEDQSPFRPTIEVFETPWNPDTQLVHIGLQGELPALEDRPPLNLVFLIDTSGSMNDPAKLPLLIQSFRLMLDRLEPQDQVAIVTYAGRAGVALEPTTAADRDSIEQALNLLQAGGSTNGVGGLDAAYDLAREMTEAGEVSRVLLATDGDFNVGLSDPAALTDYIAEQREAGTYLSVLGFGRGNLRDDMMQALAQNGNGTAAYIDTLHEAQRVLVGELAGALFPIADDVKLQVEFNPARIAEYRLIGYETRALQRQDFNNDAVDAGELGAGHSVTAIYEVTPVGSPAIRTAPLRYAAETEVQEAVLPDELGFLQMRWKEPGAETSELIAIPILPSEGAAPSEDARFAAAIASFGELLRGSDFLNGWLYSDAIELANASTGTDAFGLRREAVQLMRLAESLDR